MESSQQPPRLTARQKLLIQLLTFIGLALLIYLKPKVEAWVESRQQNQQTSNEKLDKPAEGSGKSAGNSSTSDSPWKKSDSSKAASPESSRPAETDDAAEDFDDSLMADADLEQTTEADPKAPSESKADTKPSADTAGKVAASKENKSPPRSTTKTPSTKTDKKTSNSKSKSPQPSESEKAELDASDGKMADAGSSAESSESSSATANKPATSEKASIPASAKKAESSSRKSSVTKMDRTEPTQRRVPDDAEKSNPPPATRDTAKSTLGKLKEIDDNVFESTAGLVYLPGSADGHRLRHVMEHAKDNTSKEVHGVFDGDRDQILAVIDEAFQKAQKGGADVRSEKQNGRRVYTVNLKRRIGQVGGKQGERQGNPDCRYLRLVLENDVEVVTAYPSKSF